MTKSVVIIGGGIAGLASAALLARDGYQVTLLEKHKEVGGRAGSWEKDGFRFDTGPSWYLMPEVFDHFYKLMGTSSDEQLKLAKLNPGYRVLFEEDGVYPATPVDVLDNREDNLELFEKLEPGSRPAMERYLDSAKDTYEMAKKRFLYTSFEKYGPLMRADVLRRTPKLAKLLQESLHKFASRHVSDPRLQQILGYPAVFLGSSPFITPSMYHLMSYLDLEDGVLYAQGGFNRVIESIRDIAVAEGVNLITEANVSKILTVVNPAGHKAKAKAAGVEYTKGKSKTVTTLPADIVVSAADLHFTETKLLPESLQTYGESYWEKKVSGPSAVLVYLGVKGEIPELEHHTLFFTNDWDEDFKKIFGEETSVPSPANIYVCKPSATDASVAPKGDTNLFILVPIPADVTIGQGGIDGKGSKQVEVIANNAIDQIAVWTGVPDLAKRITVRRTVGPADFANDLNSWKGGALGPSHILSQSAFFRSGNISKKVEDLYYTGGTTIPGIGLPMCLISAEILVKRLRGDTTTEPLPEPLFPTVDKTA
ncbi:phytoene desaturase family protein [Aurantimicrobium minutum]|uniref:phytoene desaturase family protein n=1 Tax=Aurantimicrobium minutum TaxID=708131 RepID=UPI0024762E0B|nr:phytoene desaturase family protein [Aurantimicrobium minutum]MDH6535948.1 phytoene desaturase [Aurantimicrobium minutum]